MTLDDRLHILAVSIYHHQVGVDRWQEENPS